MHAYDVHKTQFQDEFSSHRLQLDYCMSASYGRNSSSPLRGAESAVELGALPILLPESWQEPGHHISLFKHEPAAPALPLSRTHSANTNPWSRPLPALRYYERPPPVSLSPSETSPSPFFRSTPSATPPSYTENLGTRHSRPIPAPKHLMLLPCSSPNAARSRRAAPAYAHCLGSLPSRWGEPKPGSSGGRGASTKGTKLVRKRRHCLMFPARPPAPPLWTAFA